ncbi:MAG: hypothetical protein U9R19_02740 [Bacteroidota bacterium]|nr:hypothetical protein [Bacteroidota bacterium]
MRKLQFSLMADITVPLITYQQDVKILYAQTKQPLKTLPELIFFLGVAIGCVLKKSVKL